METPTTKTDLDLKVFARGKVRDIYDLDDKLLLVATDRISAFDYILPNGIPYKGKVLNCLSAFWFSEMGDIIQNHLITTDTNDYPDSAKKHAAVLNDRSMLVKKSERIDFECVVRGYLAGSAWKEYKADGTVCGIALPDGLTQSEKLPEVIFTPAMKADSGHDENISQEKLAEFVGEAMMNKLKDTSIALYEKAERILSEKGIILADTKFEFGMLNGELILIDEIFTPDSSRFWPKEEYSTGISPPSFDKQFVRDYLETTDWDKNSEPPALPESVIEKTAEKYLEIYRRITGKDLRN